MTGKYFLVMFFITNILENIPVCFRTMKNYLKMVKNISEIFLTFSCLPYFNKVRSCFNVFYSTIRIYYILISVFRIVFPHQRLLNKIIYLCKRAHYTKFQ